MRKIRKNTQLSLINRKGGGRRPKHDKGIRHIKRPEIKRLTSLHLTVKILKDKAGIKNKQTLALLKHAILKARKKGLRIIHFTLEYDHVHLLVEANDNEVLGRGMMVFGVTMAKGINRLKSIKGTVYKHRYHFRKINSPRELKNVLHYIFNNGIKHKTAKSLDNLYNSFRAEVRFHKLFYKDNFILDSDLISLLDRGKIHFNALMG